MFKLLIKTIFFIILISSNIDASSSIKISLIEKITQFIQWPEIKDNFKIGIYKNEKISKDMEIFYSNKKIHNLDIKIYNINNFTQDEIDDLNLIYFTKESSVNIDLILKRIKNKPILIITEFPDDVYQGMHLGIYYKEKRIKFIINQESLENANLKASYKILKLAKIVKDKK
ncbi:MAG: hypothetical protein CL623_08460 [Arcobacter sp.]|nr:hypothetical protein [Arcobacter sp.]|tara:strand:+ start:33300 stop:33815 length:516 start_codon:yes stop_codon:yes gene_type:complete